MSSPESNKNKIDEAVAADQAVVLIHGVWCLAIVMWYLGWRLRQRGYAVYCFSYASVTRDFSANVNTLSAKIETVAETVVHLVAHSYGGLVVTELLDQTRLNLNGRFVLLGSPVRGSQLAAGVMQGGLRWRLLGQAAQSPLVSGISDEKLQRVSAARSVGVISGTRNKTLLGLIFGRLESGDGLVHSGETDFPGAVQTELPESHAGMLFSDAVALKVSQFLRDGNF